MNESERSSQASNVLVGATRPSETAPATEHSLGVTGVAGLVVLVPDLEAAKGTLHLEITESLVMENPERAVEVLGWLKSFGASLALDDFGTGYCSLSYLHRFPCDTIKIDRSLVRDSGIDGSTPLILRSIIALAHELGKEVVAEGVETADDAAYLRSIGCEFGQGFYYGEPMSPKEVAALLAALASHRKHKQREAPKPPPVAMAAAAPQPVNPVPSAS